MANSVLNQVGEHLDEEVAIAGDADGRLYGGLQSLALVFRHRPIGAGDALDDIGKVERPEGGLARAGLYLGYPQKPREGRQKLVGLLYSRIDGGLIGLLRTAGQPHRLQHLSQPAERTPEIMRDVRRHMLQAFEQLLIAVEESVQVSREPVHLVGST